MDGWERALCLLPEKRREAVCRAAPGGCEEVRLRLGRAVSVGAGGREWKTAGPPVLAQELRDVLDRASASSFQAVESQMRRGYVMAGCGVRVGLCGTAVMENGRAEGLRDFSSLCIRVAHEVRGCADGIFPALARPSFSSTLIVSPPGAGKTTLLRELVRRLSDAGYGVAVADERGEIGAVGEDGAAFSLGERTDVMTALPKAQAVMQLVRTMGPQIVAMDEITDEADARALLAACGCGASLLATVHGASLESVRARPVMRRLLAAGAFEKAVFIRCGAGGRAYEVFPL